MNANANTVNYVEFFSPILKQDFLETQANLKPKQKSFNFARGIIIEKFPRKT